MPALHVMLNGARGEVWHEKSIVDELLRRVEEG